MNSFSSLLLIGASLFNTASAQDTFTLKGRIGKLNGNKVYLDYNSGTAYIHDSATVKNGFFQFKGTIAMPARATLQLDHTGAGKQNPDFNPAIDLKIVCLEKGTVLFNAADSAKNASIKGGKVNEDYAKYMAVLKKYNDEMRPLDMEWENFTNVQRNDTAITNKHFRRRAALQNKKKEIQMAYIKEHPDSYFSFTAVRELGGAYIEPAEVLPLFNMLSEATKKSPWGIAYEQRIQQAWKTALGAPAPDFSQEDTAGVLVRLSDFRGKYVLIDFWASWCGPCRAESPHLLKAYKDFRDKNFTILGVSLDKEGKKQDWLNAIKEDGLLWTQVSDLKFWNNEAARQYGISSIPQNFLVDPNGKIIAKNLRSDKLTEMLKALL